MMANGKVSASMPRSRPTVPSSAKTVNGRACAEERSGGSPSRGPRLPIPTPVNGCASPMPAAEARVSTCCLVDCAGLPRPSTSSGPGARIKVRAPRTSPHAIAALNCCDIPERGSRIATTYATTTATPVREPVIRITTMLRVRTRALATLNHLLVGARSPSARMNVIAAKIAKKFGSENVAAGRSPC
jgi:hypothetical protein